MNLQDRAETVSQGLLKKCYSEHNIKDDPSLVEENKDTPELTTYLYIHGKQVDSTSTSNAAAARDLLATLAAMEAEDSGLTNLLSRSTQTSSPQASSLVLYLKQFKLRMQPLLG